jgi:xanthine dehydrogenase accessory factor
VPHRECAVLEDIKVAVRGGGDLASGVVYRLHRAGAQVVVLELAQPRVIRRAVAFASAVLEGTIEIEGIVGRRVETLEAAEEAIRDAEVPVLVDPQGDTIRRWHPDVLVDAILAKRNLGTSADDAPIVIGLGPGFEAGIDVHAVIETNRGHYLGRVILEGHAAPDTGIPGPVMGYAEERVLRAPRSGVLRTLRKIGDLVVASEPVANVDGEPAFVRIAGVLRGLASDGLTVTEGDKIGDVDPRGIREHCFTISDKALAVGGGVLEAILYLRRQSPT